MSNKPHSDIKVSKLATLLLESLMATSIQGGLLSRLRWALLMTARKAAIFLFDPIVIFEFYGQKIFIPLSHDLPFYRRTFPFYSDNLGRVAAAISKKYGDFSVIDIGANVGDSVAIIQCHCNVRILCIEGEPKYSELLAENTRLFSSEVVIEPHFIGGNEQQLWSKVQGGTAKLENTSLQGPHSVSTKSLREILDAHPEFGSAKLLKIDTDGMDIVILDQALPWLEKQKPILFFEYDPDLQKPHRVEGLMLLRKLEQIGYGQVLVYENTGDFILALDLSNRDLLSDIHEYFSGRYSLRYCDLCVFPLSDVEIAQNLHRSELLFFQDARGYLPPVG